MAGLRTCRNPPLGGKDELARASTKGNSTPGVFRAPIFAPAQAPTPTPLSALTSGLLKRYTNKNL